MMILKTLSTAGLIVEQNKKDRVRSLAEELVRKVSDIPHQPAFSAALPKCPLHAWRGGRE